MRVIETYTVQILAPIEADPLNQIRRRVKENLKGMMLATEEDITDLLPPGWRADIRRATRLVTVGIEEDEE